MVINSDKILSTSNESIWKLQCVSLSFIKKQRNLSLRGYATKNKRFSPVYLAQTLTNTSCQTLSNSETKSFESSSSLSFQEIIAKRNRQHFIDMQLHLKSILQVLYLLCGVLHNQGTVYVVGHKADIFVSNYLFNKETHKKSCLDSKNGIIKKADQDSSKKAHARVPRNIENLIIEKPKLEIQENNWCASSLSNWQEKSGGVWRIARFLTQLQDFAVQNGHDFYQLRQKHSSLMCHLINAQKASSQTTVVAKSEILQRQDFYMPFFRQPDLLFLFGAESKRSILKQAKSLQIPTIAIYYSKQVANEALYSLPGNHKSIFLLYRLLDSFSLLAKRA